MSWEAFRLTSKSPSELYDVLGPEGVDNLMRQFLTACWNGLPAGSRTMRDWRRLASEVFERNMRVWSRIKKPDPAQFFQDLRPEPADGHLRQAMVLTWMMLPRAGGRVFADTRKILLAIYERNVAAWEEDEQTFTSAGRRTVRKQTAAKKKSAKPSKPAVKSKPKIKARAKKRK
ncbi:MAG TPA: hypothetical protein VF669_15065 [Tepidisphaeraceae bacterium]|jgi:hypothetical protein